MANSPLQPVLFLSLSVLLFLSIPVPPLSVQAQSSTSCASNLVPCANYINSTKPPDSCCTPLKDTITNDLQCLCAIYEDPSVLKAFGINLTAAEKLASNCGIDSSTTSQCKGIIRSSNFTSFSISSLLCVFAFVGTLTR
jgi:Probable lipid transfer